MSNVADAIDHLATARERLEREGHHEFSDQVNTIVTALLDSKASDADFEYVRVRDLREGDLIDLYGDPYADPNKDPDFGYEFELALVLGTEAEAPDCIRVDHDGGACGVPPGHRVYRRIPSAHMGTA